MSSNTDPWVIPLVLGFQLDLLPLITTLQTWQFSQFLLYVTAHLCSPYFTSFVYEDVTGDGVKSLIHIKINYIHCSPLIHLASHFIIDVYQTGQA